MTPTEQNQMAMCVVLHPPVALKIDLERPCFPSARGRYLYVVLVREGVGTGMMMISEIKAYSGGLCNIKVFTNNTYLSTQWQDTFCDVTKLRNYNLENENGPYSP